MRMPNRLRGVAAALTLVGMPLSAQSVCDLVASNLVTNCGFESRTFAGWTETGVAFGNQINTNSGVPHSGSVAAAFVSTTGASFIQQVLATTPGTSYDVSFWVQNRAFGSASQPGGQFTFDWAGVNRLSLANPAAFPYQQYSFVFAATGATTAVRFGGFEGQTTFPTLDDVVVTASTVPEPATLALTAAGIVTLMLLRRKRRTNT